MTFGITPTTGFPPAGPDVFPTGLQWQLAGAAVGTRAVDTVNFVSGDALAMVVDPDDPKLLTITIPTGSGGGGATVPNLVLSLFGAAPMSFDNTDFTTWLATPLVTSTDAEWNDDTGEVTFLATGFFRVTVSARIAVDGETWVTNVGNASQVTKYGSALAGTSAPVTAMTRSVHERTADGVGTVQELSPSFVQWSDEYIVEVLNVNETSIPAIYAQHFDATEVANALALVTVTKLS